MGVTQVSRIDTGNDGVTQEISGVTQADKIDTGHGGDYTGKSEGDIGKWIRQRSWGVTQGKVGVTQVRRTKNDTVSDLIVKCIA